LMCVEFFLILRAVGAKQSLLLGMDASCWLPRRNSFP
jgi:hypothetical protein